MASNEIKAFAVLLECGICMHQWTDVWIAEPPILVSCPNCGNINEPKVIKDLL